jgi:predicted  nucleic acid-binding Zn-ribbon protein
MMEIIEKLLILQDRDRRLKRLQAELDQVPRQREAMLQKDQSARAALEASRQKVNELESSRKQLDLEVEAKKELIERYANQQLQTRKNEEYRALAKEIDGCKAAITRIEDQEIELMEQGEAAQKQVLEATREADEAKKLVDSEISALDERGVVLNKELEELEAERETLAGNVEEGTLDRYERLFGSKGENVVVGVHNGVCGGCHMKLPAQQLVSCKGGQELISCTNCGRILYYTRDMSLAADD